jgi:hypothetical protein
MPAEVSDRFRQFPARGEEPRIADKPGAPEVSALSDLSDLSARDPPPARPAGVRRASGAR